MINHRKHTWPAGGGGGGGGGGLRPLARIFSPELAQKSSGLTRILHLHYYIISHCGGPISNFLKFDVCVVWWCSDGPINSQEYKSFNIDSVIYQDIYDWISPLNKPPGTPLARVPFGTANRPFTLHWYWFIPSEWLSQKELFPHHLF